MPNSSCKKQRFEDVPDPANECRGVTQSGEEVLMRMVVSAFGISPPLQILGEGPFLLIFLFFLNYLQLVLSKSDFRFYVRCLIIFSCKFTIHEIFVKKPFETPPCQQQFCFGHTKYHFTIFSSNFHGSHASQICWHISFSKFDSMKNFAATSNHTNQVEFE